MAAPRQLILISCIFFHSMPELSKLCAAFSNISSLDISSCCNYCIQLYPGSAELCDHLSQDRLTVRDCCLPPPALKEQSI